MAKFSALVLIIFGLATLYEPFTKGFLEFNNALRGSKSNITKGILQLYKVLGVILAIVGFIILVTYP